MDFSLIHHRLELRGGQNPPLTLSSSAHHTLDVVLNKLQDESTQKIGIWGMGGLQNELGNRLKIKIDANESNDTVASKLLRRLEGKKYLLLLDDVWDEVDLSVVGFPNANQQNGCKVVLTTRKKEVCRKMGTDAEVPVSILPNEEAWEMFSSGVGHVATLPTIKPYAQDIVTECGGLPLALKVVCGALRKEENVNVWRNFLRKLRSPATSIIEDLNENVFKVLKVSYDRLKNIKEKKCLLLCGLFEIGKRGMKSEELIIPVGMICEIPHIEVIELTSRLSDERTKIIAKELSNLGSLSSLAFDFHIVGNLQHFLQNSIPWKEKRLTQFMFLAGKYAYQRYVGYFLLFQSSKKYKRFLAYVGGGEERDSGLPPAIEDVLIRSNCFLLCGHEKLKALSELGTQNIDELRFCWIRECVALETIVNRNGLEMSTFSNLEVLFLAELSNLKSILCLEMEEGQSSSSPPPPPLNVNSFTNLTKLDVWRCPLIEHLFSSGFMLQQMSNLKDLNVMSCRGLKGMIPEDEKVEYEALPKLSCLHLYGLPEFVNLFEGVLTCWQSLDRVIIGGTPKLRKLPFDTNSAPNLKGIGGSDQEWWDTLEWDNHAAKLQLLKAKSGKEEKTKHLFVKFLKANYSLHAYERKEYYYITFQAKDVACSERSLPENFQALVGAGEDEATALDKGEAILQALIDASLLEKCDKDDSVKMHDVVRDIVLAITSLQGEEPTHLVRAGISSQMIPKEVEWKNATQISFVNRDLRSLPESPNCPKLLTLLLQGNENLEVIQETFFNNMPSLRVLDLSRTCIKLLPTSISKLDGLRELVLLDCKDLEALPKEITALKELEVLYVGRSKLKIGFRGMKRKELIIPGGMICGIFLILK
ncbi:hypothetical protein RHGRI_033318 [Rhododendron griersonianum]|uniref:NB-ARC domain-containing protein n=1 Tax=Rhododendron griersonianum TaxID=479676 RepID=A0AAV6HYU6_9ERIC|nr:hypothetical protein RHGRI_033318 [Rhododendron griersonianum]